MLYLYRFGLVDHYAMLLSVIIQHSLKYFIGCCHREILLVKRCQTELVCILRMDIKILAVGAAPFENQNGKSSHWQGGTDREPKNLRIPCPVVYLCCKSTRWIYIDACIILILKSAVRWLQIAFWR